MSQPVVLLAPTLSAARQAAAQRFVCREQTLILGHAAGISRSWREVLRDADLPSQNFLPRFVSLQEWFVEAATLAAAPLWSTPADRRFLLRSLLPTLRPRIQILHRLCQPNELVRQLDLLIADLRRAGQETLRFGGDWGQELQLIVSEYNQRLRECNAIDIECAPSVWTKNQKNSIESEITCIVFDQILSPSPIQWDAMQTLGAQAGSTLVTLVMPWLQSETKSWDEVLAQTKDTAPGRVLELWRDAESQLEIIPCDAQKTERQNAARALLSYRRMAAPAHLDLTSAYTPRDEVEHIAGHVRAACNAPQDLENRALVLPSAATYTGILEPVFEAHGVPLNVSRARPHNSYPLVARLLSALQLHDSDWELDEIADLFGDGLLRLYCDKENDSALDIHRLRQACFDSRLDSLRDEAETLRRLLQKSASEENLDPEIERDLARIANLRESVARIHAASEATEWRNEIFALVEMTLGHLSRQDGSTPIRVALLRQKEAFKDAVEYVLSHFMRWQPTLLQGKKSESNSFADLAFDCLRLKLETTTAPLEEKSGAGLNVINPLQLLSDVPREIYFAGLTESAWPTSGASRTLLSRHRSQLEKLREHEIEPTQMARYLLALAVVEADAIHLLHPTRSGGREVLRSPILEDVALCWENIPAMVRPTLPTSRTGLLQLLGEWRKAGNATSLPSPFSPQMCAALKSAKVREADLTLQNRIHNERNSAEKLGIYDGALGERGARLLQEVSILSGQENRLLQSSASSLKIYAQCPLKFFYRYLLNIGAPSVWQDEPPGTQGGLLIHRILEKFWKQCSLNLSVENQTALWNLLQRISLKEIEAEPLRPLLREVEARRLLGRDENVPGGMLGAMLLAEIAQSGGEEKKPAFAAPLLPLSQSGISLPPEFRQGIELSLTLPLVEMKIVARIDRVVASGDGDILAIIDYKTESPTGLPTFSHADWGFDFQLPVYLLATRAQLQNWRDSAGESTPKPNLAAAFFALRDGTWMKGFGEKNTLGRNQTKQGPGAICHPQGKELDSEAFDFWLDKIQQRIFDLGAFVQRAQFNISIQSRELSNCKYCDFKTICRRDDAVAISRLDAAHAALEKSEIYIPRPILNKERAGDE